MNNKEVVTLSLKTVKSRVMLFIPGEENRFLTIAVRKPTLKKSLKCKIL